MVKDSEVEKEAQVTELTKQCNELIQSRTIQMSLVMNRKLPQTSTSTKSLKDDSSKQTKDSKKNQTKAGGKNLQLAMELNREMEEMFGETAIQIDNPKPTKRTKKKQNKQVKFFDAQQQDQKQQ